MDVIGGLKEGLTMDEEKWLSKESPFFLLDLLRCQLRVGTTCDSFGEIGRNNRVIFLLRFEEQVL